jgi:hypothetical protein
MEQRRLVSDAAVCSVKLSELSALLYVVVRFGRVNVSSCLQSILLERIVTSVVVVGIDEICRI